MKVLKLICGGKTLAAAILLAGLEWNVSAADVLSGKTADPPKLSSASATNLVSGGATNAPASAPLLLNSMSALDDKHKLGPADRVSFRVIEDQDEPRTLMVSDAGDMDVPYIGLVKAADKTCKQLSGEIKEALERDYYYQATVIMAVEQLNKITSRGKIYLVGFVRVPGAQEIPMDENYTVSKAILRCGGFTDFADKKKVRLVRRTGPKDEDKKTFVINVAEIWEKGKSSSDVIVEPEDLIYVPARLVNF